jgi:hypothetical protein
MMMLTGKGKGECNAVFVAHCALLVVWKSWWDRDAMVMGTGKSGMEDRETGIGVVVMGVVASGWRGWMGIGMLRMTLRNGDSCGDKDENSLDEGVVGNQMQTEISRRIVQLGGWRWRGWRCG